MKRDNNQTPGFDFCDETRRNHDIHRHYVNPIHPIRRFDVGNEELYNKRSFTTSRHSEKECEQHCK